MIHPPPSRYCGWDERCGRLQEAADAGRFHSQPPPTMRPILPCGGPSWKSAAAACLGTSESTRDTLGLTGTFAGWIHPCSPGGSRGHRRRESSLRRRPTPHLSPAHYPRDGRNLPPLEQPTIPSRGVPWPLVPSPTKRVTRSGPEKYPPASDRSEKSEWKLFVHAEPTLVPKSIR